MSKGSTPRPFAIKPDEFAGNYCRAFGHKFKDGRCKSCGHEEHGSEPAKDGQPIEGQA